MRLLAFAFLVAALGAGCSSDGAAPPSPPTTTANNPPSAPPSGASGPMVTMPCSDAGVPSDAPVDMKYVIDIDGKCVQTPPDPDPVYICDYTKTVTWYLTNNCKKTVNVSIGPRKSADDAANTDDPLKENDNIYSDPSPVPTPASVQTPGKATIVARVDMDAKNDCYKYSIGGTFPVDPEIEVRRAGSRKECPSPRPAGSTQAPPSGKR